MRHIFSTLIALILTVGFLALTVVSLSAAPLPPEDPTTCALSLPFTGDSTDASVIPACAASIADENQPQVVIVHATGTDFIASLKRYRDGTDSTHYLIDLDGMVYQLLPEKLPAYHISCADGGCLDSCPAGLCDGQQAFPELRSIHIGLVSTTKDSEEYSDPRHDPLIQMIALRSLLREITDRHYLPMDDRHILPASELQDQEVDFHPLYYQYWQDIVYQPYWQEWQDELERMGTQWQSVY